MLHISQSSSITGTIQSDCFVSYLGHSLRVSYPSAEVQSVYSIAPADWAIHLFILMYWNFTCHSFKLICDNNLSKYKNKYTIRIGLVGFCSREDLPKTMNDREGWQERVRDIRADGMTRWLWHTNSVGNSIPNPLYMVLQTYFVDNILKWAWALFCTQLNCFKYCYITVTIQHQYFV